MTSDLRSGRDPLTGVLLLFAVPALVAGLSMPAISVRQWIIFEDTYSLIEGIASFYARGDVALSVLLALFTVAFPALKIVAGTVAWWCAVARGPVLARLLMVLNAASRWSMLDVLLVALMVLVVDGRLLVSSDIQVGILLYAGAGIASTVATHRLVRIQKFRAGWRR